MEQAMPDNTGLVWDSYICNCGGHALMGIMSLVARCPNCPRVYAMGRWHASLDEANKEYAQSAPLHK